MKEQKTSAQVFVENQYSEFTTFFRIPFKETPWEEVFGPHCWKDLIGSWAQVCILALELRMDSCVSMLFRNRNNVLISNQFMIVFKKSNGQVHTFNHASFKAMEDMIKALQQGDWKHVEDNILGIRQLLKALYWIPEDMRKDHGGFGFGQLISCLEELTLISNDIKNF